VRACVFVCVSARAEVFVHGKGVDDDKGCLLQALHVSCMGMWMSFVCAHVCVRVSARAEVLVLGKGVDDDKGCLLQALHVS